MIEIDDLIKVGIGIIIGSIFGVFPVLLIIATIIYLLDKSRREYKPQPKPIIYEDLPEEEEEEPKRPNVFDSIDNFYN